ncbi:MAG: NAD(P)/FAD-dependent oxidoreductase [Pseudomonadota bacterium]
MTQKFDVIIIGAGASGLMCATQAGKRGRQVLVIDHGPAPGRKILMSGGGRCNFTNRRVSADQYISGNPHFCKSALSRFTSTDFIALVEAHGIAFHEREHGQLFCTGSASEILDMLLAICRGTGVEMAMNTPVEQIGLVEPQGDCRYRFRIQAGARDLLASSLVVATGGVSLPGAGASPFGYKVAEQFQIPVLPPRPGLVPFTLQPGDREILSGLAGVSVDAGVSTLSVTFREKLLFTHRGLSGPVILQVSSYWQAGDPITIDLLPGMDLAGALRSEQAVHPKRHVKSVLSDWLPKRLVDVRLDGTLADCPIVSVSHDQFRLIAEAFHAWIIQPGGTEGYRTAEVTVGGVDCNHISSKTLEARQVQGLFFIGEVLDVTGWLGGYNLQWAWSSGWCAGQYV